MSCPGFRIDGQAIAKLLLNTSTGDFFFPDDTQQGSVGIILEVDSSLIHTEPIVSYEWRTQQPSHQAQHLDPYVGANALNGAVGRNGSRIFIRTHDANGDPTGVISVIMGCNIKTQNMDFFVPCSAPTPGVTAGSRYIEGVASYMTDVVQSVNHPLAVKYSAIMYRPAVQEVRTPADMETVVNPHVRQYSATGYSIPNATPNAYGMMGSSNPDPAVAFATEAMHNGFHNKSFIKTMVCDYEWNTNAVPPNITYYFGSFNNTGVEVKTYYSFT